MLKYQVIPVTLYAQNCTLLWCDQTNSAAVIDPGGDIDKIELVAKKHQVNIEQIWITHGHLDHAAGAAALAKVFDAPILGPHEDDLFWLEMLSERMVRATPGFEHAQSFLPKKWLKNADTLTLGQEVLEVRHCPGHTPGHVVFYSKSAKLAFVGDVLFAGSVGRTDFPKGNQAQLFQSIKTQLWPLGDDTEFVAGHGPNSSFGAERRTNPFVGGT